MKFRFFTGGSALAACVFMSAAAQAATLTGDFATWAAAAGSSASAPSTGLPLYSSPVTAVTLSDGSTVSLSGTADTVLQPLAGWGEWSGGYTGDIIVTTTNSETLSFAGRSALALDLSPDVGLFGPYGETFTVTLSDGTTAQFSGNYPAGVTQFVGFYGSNITSMTITATNSPDFAFAFDAPEPVSLALLLTGMAGLGLVRRRSR